MFDLYQLCKQSISSSFPKHFFDKPFTEQLSSEVALSKSNFHISQQLTASSTTSLWDSSPTTHLKPHTSLLLQLHHFIFSTAPVFCTPQQHPYLPQIFPESIVTMSSPAKGSESSSKLPDLAPWELRLLIYGSLCYGDAKVLSSGSVFPSLH